MGGVVATGLGIVVGVSFVAFLMGLGYYLALDKYDRADLRHFLRNLIPGLLFILGMRLMTTKERQHITWAIRQRNTLRWVPDDLYSHTDRKSWERRTDYDRQMEAEEATKKAAAAKNKPDHEGTFYEE